MTGVIKNWKMSIRMFQQRNFASFVNIKTGDFKQLNG